MDRPRVRDGHPPLTQVVRAIAQPSLVAGRLTGFRSKGIAAGLSEKRCSRPKQPGADEAIRLHVTELVGAGLHFAGLREPNDVRRTRRKSRKFRKRISATRSPTPNGRAVRPEWRYFRRLSDVCGIAPD